MWSPSAPGVAAGVIDDARARQSRRRTLAAAATVAVLISATLIAPIGPTGREPGAPGAGSPAAGQTLRAGALTLTVPAGWHWRIQLGNYRACTNPIVRLWVASYALPARFAQPEGPGTIVVPANAVLLAITSLPIRSSATPWNRWRLSNRALRPWRSVGRLDPNRVRAEVVLPRSAAVVASALLGSVPMPRAALTAGNGLLRSIRVDRHYACR